VALTKREFVAQGGEGSVYAVGNTAIKVYADAGLALPLGKLTELSGIGDARVIRPLELVTSPSGGVVGYAMRYVPDTRPLCALIPAAYRARQGLDDAAMLGLLGALRDVVCAVHAAGVLIVDLHEMNVLVGPNHRDVYAIDVDSWQTRSYPATALLDQARDWLAAPGAWSEQTDWYSYAVLAFQLLVGMHPFKGKHATVKGIEARAKSGLWAFSTDVQRPSAASRLDRLPPGWAQWFEGVFCRGERSAPPVGGQLPAAVPRAALVAPDALMLDVLAELAGDVVDVVDRGGPVVIRTTDGVTVDGLRLTDAAPGEVVVGFDSLGKPVVGTWYDGALSVVDHAGRPLPLSMDVHEVMAHDGRIVVRSGDRLVELRALAGARGVLLLPHVVGRVLPHATRLFPGCAIQGLFGATLLSVLPAAGRCHQLHVPELDGRGVIDARLSGTVLMVLATRGGRYDRLVLRFAEDFSRYDVSVVAEVSPVGLAFVTLGSGVCVCLAEDDAIELFSSRPGSSRFKRIDGSGLDVGRRLFERGGRVAVARGSTLFRLSMR
jgi:hypothetical protein